MFDSIPTSYIRSIGTRCYHVASCLECNNTEHGRRRRRAINETAGLPQVFEFRSTNCQVTLQFLSGLFAGREERPAALVHALILRTVVEDAIEISAEDRETPPLLLSITWYPLCRSTGGRASGRPRLHY